MVDALCRGREFPPVPPANYPELAKWILAETGCYARCYVANQVPEITGESVVEAPGIELGLRTHPNPAISHVFAGKGSESLGFWHAAECSPVLGSSRRSATVLETSLETDGECGRRENVPAPADIKPAPTVMAPGPSPGARRMGSGDGALSSPRTPAF